MADLKKRIGTMIPRCQKVVDATEFSGMHYIADRMAHNDFGHLSQIPLAKSLGDKKYTRVVTTNDLARWVRDERPDDPFGKQYSEEVKRWSYDTPLEEVIDIVANHGYVIVTSEDGGRDHILTYTEVIRELAST